MNRRFHSILVVPWVAMRLCALVFVLGVLAGAVTSASAQQPQTFVPPQQYPTDRYESTWRKNPFTLKTAPVIEQKKSFAQDLVLYNAYRVDGVTVVIANKKTKEMFRLKESEPASNGMKIRSVMIQDSLKDTYVEVELNGESAVLRYDDTFKSQMVASNSARGNRGPGGAGELGARERQRMEQLNGEGAPGAAPPGEVPGASPSPVNKGANPANTPRPPLPQRPGPRSPTPDGAPPDGEPASIRPPGPRRVLPLPPRGSAPTPVTRRLLTAPVVVPAPAAPVTSPAAP